MEVTDRTLRAPYREHTWIMNQPLNPVQKRRSLFLSSSYLAFWVFYGLFALCSALAAR